MNEEICEWRKKLNKRESKKKKRRNKGFTSRHNVLEPKFIIM